MGLLLFQNEACLVINKLPGESSEATLAGGAEEGKLLPVHRLDTPVSGCLLLAKTQEAAAFLGAAFARKDGVGRVEKRYWAIIEKPPLPLPESAELLHYLRVDPKKNKSFAGNEGGKKALLRYRIAGAGKNYLFLEIDLVTGRHHQIRAQLAAEGMHVKGDLKYGARRSEKEGGIRLHAYSLAFPNPLDPGETIKVKTLPPQLDPLWQAFTKAVNS